MHVQGTSNFTLLYRNATTYGITNHFENECGGAGFMETSKAQFIQLVYIFNFWQQLAKCPRETPKLI